MCKQVDRHSGHACQEQEVCAYRFMDRPCVFVLSLPSGHCRGFTRHHDLPGPRRCSVLVSTIIIIVPRNLRYENNWTAESIERIRFRTSVVPSWLVNTRNLILNVNCSMDFSCSFIHGSCRALPTEPAPQPGPTSDPSYLTMRCPARFIPALAPRLIFKFVSERGPWTACLSFTVHNGTAHHFVLL
ncbi:hypothetical protein C8Q69DRAFT_187187 [Paecilomyces variotii]|uniref:Uncharacterized protein n=1 Tax=Byssochlamys spectabilis TaxID=264951 RepID=A0A443HI81_BYSSP|nr:hypothetical protein C8Q69DRAFT_187187 [Paecilomyces variotii]RWQ91505.1 hypothetical protein C8Q69DRAFT_187187 [Paecilomyces variotii]